MKDGSVIFLEGGPFSRPIMRQTDSPLTHAAILLFEGQTPWVYEAVVPAVHRITWRDFLDHLGRHKAIIMEPRIAFNSRDLIEMKSFARSQIGRPYMIRGWWKGHEVRGVFCSEYVADIVERSGRIVSGHVNESPGSLYHKLLPTYETRTD